MLYNEEIAKKFHEKEVLDILKDNIYQYRERQKETNFHFLIGLCMLELSYLEEAHMAFVRATKEEGMPRNHLFVAVSLVRAQRYEEAKKYLEENVHLGWLKPSELTEFMEIRYRLDLDNDWQMKYFLEIRDENSLDDLVFSVFCYVFNRQNDAAVEAMDKIPIGKFKDNATLFGVIKDLYKLHLDKEALFRMIDRINVVKIKEEDMPSFLKMLVGTEYFVSLSVSDRQKISGIIAHRFRKNNEILAQISCMNYDVAEKNNDEVGKKKAIRAIQRINKKGKTEQTLAYLISDSFSHFASTDKMTLKKRIEKLISLNQGSLKYREYYFEFLRLMGRLNEAQEVAKATLSYRKKKEHDEFELVKKFHSFYDNRVCIFLENPKHETEECPLCFGNGYKPIIKTIAFGHSPKEIFSDAVESHTIEVDEKTLHAIVDWQPMNMPSPIVGEYLHSLGAYSTTHEFPSVLVEGQTYIFIRMKTEAYKRLAKEGYTLNQIDPLANVFLGITKQKPKENIFTTEKDKPIEKGLVSANDFVLEIIKAVTPKDA